VDWNEDGKKDLVVGDSYGVIYIVLNTGSDSSPVFSTKSRLSLGAGYFDCGYRAMPDVVDWNNDGKKDLLCGDDYGRVSLLLNTGTNSSPVFSSSSLLTAGGGTLDCSSRASPAAIDWNGDGKKDLLCGNVNGTVYYYENVGTDAAPSLNSGVLLRLESGSTIDVGSTSRIGLSDWNNDGGVDILVGNYTGTVRVYLAEPSDVDPPTYSGNVGVVSIGWAPGGRDEAWLTWNEAQDETTPANSIRYNVYASTDPGQVFSGAPVATFVGVTEGVVSGLATPAIYYFGVRAQDAAGNEESNRVWRTGPYLAAADRDVWEMYR